MHIDDFLLNFRQTYKSGKSEEGSKDLNEETLRREFEYYSEDKLDKIWQAVRRHHKATWYPIIGQVLECMDKAGVNESSKESSEGVTYNRCNTCGCNYSLHSRLCPKCNKYLEQGNTFYNEVTIVKGFKFAPDHITCHETCSICPIFKGNFNARGAKCPAWNTHDDFQKSNKKCIDCPCKTCCNEKMERDENWKLGTLMRNKASDDSNWDNYYKDKGIEKDTILKYCGSLYKNLTGKTRGQSPKTDNVNWKFYIPKPVKKVGE